MIREDLEYMKAAFESDSFASALGISLTDFDHRSIRMEMPLTDAMANWFGRPHGGAIYALADAAFSLLANNQNNLSVALDCSITYHASPEVGTLLIAEGEVLSITRRTGAYLFKLYAQTPDGRTPVATMKSVAYRTGKEIHVS